MSGPAPGGTPGGPAGAPVHLDVRDDIRAGREPLARIVAAADALGPGEVLVLRAPFEPRPLYRVLGRRGFAHRAESRAADDWCVWFYRETASAGEAAGPAAPSASEPGPGDDRAAGGSGDPVRLDVRGLEPPLPMLRVLEAAEGLGPGQSLEVLHDRRPVFLYPQLDARGLMHETEEPAPGVIRIVIRRAADRP